MGNKIYLKLWFNPESVLEILKRLVFVIQPLARIENKHYIGVTPTKSLSSVLQTF